MSNLNIDAFSPLKGFLDDETSSEEDVQEDYIQFGDLYDYIGAPNPLPEEKKPSASDVRTAYNLNFTKLPEELYTASTSELDSTKPNVTEEVTLSLDNLRKIDTDDTKAKQTTLVIPDSLFSLYPRTDPKLVYQKYKDQGDWEMKTKFYASYLVNIGNLVNNSQGKLQYRGNEGDIRDIGTNQLSSSLQFDSRFESGNLFAAYKVSEFEYDLILQNDINSKGHTQWFFFSVSNMIKGRTIKFNIVNLMKPESLFNEGMKPAVFSTYDNVMNGEGWKRAGFNLSYSRNNINKEGLFNKSYYTLTFNYTFSHSNDTVYFAHSFPYTYSNLKTYLTNLCENPAKKMYIVRRTLCMTLGKNECEYLSITSPSDLENIEKRCGIIISARQHPGESLSSFMMEGFLDFITSDEPEAVVLRNHCVFKVIPMLNPDGVIHGNYRTSLCGRDLNRIWNKPNPTLHPTIYHTKELIRKMESRRKLRLICDLHGHSRKKNAFFYGNATDDNPYNARVFPMIMSKLSKFVSFEDSRFVIQRSKEKTARVALWKQLKLDNVFTLEASFYGYTQENGTVKNFTKDDYRELGADLARSLYVYLRDVTFDAPNPSQFIVPTNEDLRDPSAERIKKYQSDRSTKKNRRSLSTSNPTGLSNSAMKAKQTLQDKRGSPTKIGKPETKINCTRLIEEMKNNKQLIAIGNNAEDSGSDTDNSEDDIADKELKKVLPVKMVGKTKKKKNKQSKKKTTIVVSKKEEKKTEDKDKKPVPAKVDSSTNTVAVQQVQSDKTIEQQSSAKKFKMPLRKILREPLIKGRIFVAEPIQEQQAGVEMVSIGIQTEDTGYYRYESQDTSLERQLGPMNKGVGLFADTRGWSQPHLSQNQKLGNPSVAPGKLFVVGEKAGIDGNGGIDYFYKLGKNQISRSVLARVQPKTVGSEVRQAQIVEQKRKSESVSSENLQNSKKQKIIISKMDKNEVKSSSTANSLHYYLYYKDAEIKSNTITAESYAQNSNMISDRLEDSKFRFKIESNKTPVKDFREAPEIKKSLSLKNLENKEIASEGQTPVPNSSSQLKLARLNIKEKPLIPLPRLLRNPTNTRPESKEPLTTDLSGLMNNSLRRMGSIEEDVSLYKTKLNKLPSQNMTATSFAGSYRDSFTEKMDAKREKLPLGLIKEYSGLTNRFLDSPSVQTPKAQEKNGGKEKTTKLERVLSSDVKFDIDRKAVELDTFTAKGKRPQNSMLRKI